jgi:hypothetical protein
MEESHTVGHWVALFLGSCILAFIKEACRGPQRQDVVLAMSQQLARERAEARAELIEAARLEQEQADVAITIIAEPVLTDEQKQIKT